MRTVDLRNKKTKKARNSRGRANSVIGTRAHDSVGKANFIPGFSLYSTTIEFSCGSLQ